MEVHGRGSDVEMEHPDGRRVVFPFHDEIDRHTLKGVLTNADVDLAEFHQAGRESPVV
jgi:predicted RNA binding protein YcfA (HicA-like mRNA interferase family)